VPTSRAENRQRAKTKDREHESAKPASHPRSGREPMRTIPHVVARQGPGSPDPDKEVLAHLLALHLEHRTGFSLVYHS